MSRELNEAAKAHAVRKMETDIHDVIAGPIESFLAGAAWQREQDAKLREAVRFHVVQYGDPTGKLRDLCGAYASDESIPGSPPSEQGFALSKTQPSGDVSGCHRPGHSQNDPCPRECPEQGTVHFHAGHAQNENADECNEANGWCYNCAICKNLMDAKKESQDDTARKELGK